eukprot:9250698-Pyramimonas_sp.AAC.1
MFSERKPDVLNQNRLGQKCSENMSSRPHKVPGTLFGRPIGCTRTLRHTLIRMCGWRRPRGVGGGG